MEKEDIIGLYPAPDADNNGETLHISYFEDPTAITASTSESAILWDLTWAAIYWAASKIFENDGDQGAADRYEMKYERIVVKAKRRKEKGQRRKPLQTMAHRQYTIDPDNWIEPYDVDVGQRGA